MTDPTGTVPPLSPEEEAALRRELTEGLGLSEHLVARLLAALDAARTPRETPDLVEATPEASMRASASLAAALERTDRYIAAMAASRAAPDLLAALTAVRNAASLTRSVDVERWQRIETAARTLVALAHPSSDLGDQHIVRNAEYDDLRDALGEG